MDKYLYYSTCFLFGSRARDFETNWLKNGIDWRKNQNEDMEREQEAESMSTGRRQARQALVVGKKLQEHKKYQLLCRLNKT